MMTSMELVTFGEAMVRLTPPHFQRIEHTTSFDVHVGGAELNVAVGASRLGTTARWVSRLPTNALGRMIANRARQHGVDLSCVDWAQDGRAGLYFTESGAAPRASSVLYDRAESSISRLAPGTIDWSAAFAGARWCHTSGVTPALSPSAAAATSEALAAAKAAGLTVSYDLNYRAKLWSAESARVVQEALMRNVDVLITTEEDARVVFGVAEGQADANFRSVDSESYGRVAKVLAERFGFKAVAITLRENPRVWSNSWSAILYADATVYKAPRYEVEVADRIGAGDAFSAGLISAMIRAGDWQTALQQATALSALKHTIPGDFALFDQEEVERVMRGSSLRVAR